MNPPRIVIFAKAPLPGFAKTRLIPALGAEQAAALAHRMLEASLAGAIAADLGPIELCVTPAIDTPAWRGVAIPRGIEISAQGDGDLGERLARAARRCIERGESLLLIGTDCPALRARHLRDAANALLRADTVMYPACDGGYVLFGLRRFHPSLFGAIPWSTSRVADITRARIRTLGWSLETGVALPDIDEPADLVHVPQEWLLAEPA